MPIMKYDEWMKRTRVLTKPRSKGLRVLDACIREYSASPGNRALIDALYDASWVWADTKQDAYKSIRNKDGAVADLFESIDEFRAKNMPAAHLVPTGHLAEIRGTAGLKKADRPKVQINVTIPIGVKDTSKGTAIYEGFDSQQLIKAKRAWAEAYRCADLAVRGASSINTNPKEYERFVRWFGLPETPGTYQTVCQGLKKMAAAFKTNQVTMVLREDIQTHIVNGDAPFDEMEEGFKGSDVYGYVYHHLAGSGYRVILGKWFLGDPDPIEGATQTIYHELNHKVLRTTDHKYGKIQSRGLATALQQQALTNADNWAFYAISFIKNI